MTVPYSVATNDTVLPLDINQYKNLLEGAAGYTDTFVLVSTAGTNFIVRLGDAAGVNKFVIQDSASVEQASINSDGLLTASFSASAGSFILPQAASPSQTAEGSISWDTNDDVLTVGTGAATKRLGLTRGAGSDATATAELVYDTTAARLKVWDGSASQTIDNRTYAYKSATQVFTTDTTFADITTAAGGVAGDFAFDVAANGIYKARYVLPLSFGGTGGVKLQFTGPATPTLVRADAFGQVWNEQSNDTAANTETDVLALNQLGVATAFSSSVVARSGAAAGTSGTSGTISEFNSGTSTLVIYIDLFIVNGANAGTVVLQGAQNSSNSTTTFAVGCWMEAKRLA